MRQTYKDRSRIRLVLCGVSLLLFGLVLVGLTATPLRAQTAGFMITKFTIAGGGDAIYGGGYTLQGVAGQAGGGFATDGSYRLTGGFVVPGEEGVQESGQGIYLPFVATTQ